MFQHGAEFRLSPSFYPSVWNDRYPCRLHRWNCSSPGLWRPDESTLRYFPIWFGTRDRYCLNYKGAERRLLIIDTEVSTIYLRWNIDRALSSRFFNFIFVSITSNFFSVTALQENFYCLWMLIKILFDKTKETRNFSVYFFKYANLTIHIFLRNLNFVSSKLGLWNNMLITIFRVHSGVLMKNVEFNKKN